MSVRLLFVCGTLAVAGTAHAQSNTPGGMPPPPGMSLAESAAMRFPQPVRAGDLSVERFSVLSRARMFSAGFAASFAAQTVRSWLWSTLAGFSASVAGP